MIQNLFGGLSSSLKLVILVIRVLILSKCLYSMTLEHPETILAGDTVVE